MLGRLNGKVALVTGGSSGMGLATAQLFVDHGAVVYITGRHHEPVEAASARVGSQLHGVVADSSNLGDIDRLFSTITAEAGRLDVLFASAGLGWLTELLAEVTPESFDHLFGLNVRGTLFTAQKAAESHRTDRSAPRGGRRRASPGRRRPRTPRRGDAHRLSYLHAAGVRPNRPAAAPDQRRHRAAGE
jgi:NAD(P)-dependent dehydrogenase (short-subunit alcohol dehydrogenase family)